MSKNNVDSIPFELLYQLLVEVALYVLPSALLGGQLAQYSRWVEGDYAAGSKASPEQVRLG